MIITTPTTITTSTLRADTRDIVDRLRRNVETVELTEGYEASISEYVDEDGEYAEICLTVLGTPEDKCFGELHSELFGRLCAGVPDESEVGLCDEGEYVAWKLTAG